MPRTENYARDFLAGKPAALKALYADTSAMLYRVIFRMTGSREDAEDILHDVYIRAYDKRKSYRPELSGLRTWLYRIAVNHTLNVLKRRKWLGGHLGRIFGAADERARDVLEDCADAEENQTAQRLLAAVPENFRICLVLRELEDRSYEEIAGLLKLSAGTVKSRINRGRKILQELYKKEAVRNEL